MTILTKSDHLDECHGNDKHFNITPLTYNGEDTKMAWPKVIDIRNLRHAGDRHGLSHQVL